MSSPTITVALLNDLRAQIDAAVPTPGSSQYETVMAGQPSVLRVILSEMGSDAQVLKVSDSKVGDEPALRITMTSRYDDRETFYVTEDGYLVSRYQGSYGSTLRWSVQKGRTNLVREYLTARYGMRGTSEYLLKGSNLAEIGGYINTLRDFENSQA